MDKYLHLFPGNITLLFALLLLFIIVIVKVILEIGPSSFVAYKIKKINGFNILWLWFSFVIIIYASSVLFNWFLNRQNFTKIENYVIVSFLIVVISIFFSIIEWVFSLFINNSFILQSQYQDHLKKKYKKYYDFFERKYNRSLNELENIKKNLDENFVLSSPVEVDDYIIPYIKDVVYDPKYIRYKYSIYDTNVENVKLVERHKFKKPRNFRFIYYQLEIFIVSGHFAESLEWKIEYRKEDKSGKNLKYLIDLITLKEKTIKKEIEFEVEISSAPIYPLFDIIINNMYELLSIRQGYYMPNNIVLKLIHLFFGVYKFIFLGSLLSLLLK